MNIFTNEMIEKYKVLLQNFFESREYVVAAETDYESIIANLLRRKCITDDDIVIIDGLENSLFVYRIENENDFEELKSKYPWKKKSTVLFMCERMEYILNLKQEMKAKRISYFFAFSGAGEEDTFPIKVSGRVNSLFEENEILGNSVKGYVFTAKLKDIIDIYNRRGENLFQKNVRFSLDDGANDVAKEINETLKTGPDEFWFLNNGITILSNADINMNRMDMIELQHNIDKDFFVINGAQTVSAAHKFFYEKKSENNQYYIDVAEDKAMVLVRIIVATKDEIQPSFGISFGEKMSISLNRQKPIKAEDLAYYSSYVRVLNQIYDEKTDSEEFGTYFKIVRRGEEKTSEYRMHSLTKVAKALFVLENDSPKEAKNTSNDTALALKDNQLEAPIFSFAKGLDDDKIKECLYDKYLHEYKYVNWVLACEKAYYESIDKLVPNGGKADLANKTKVFMRNGNWYFIAYLLKDIIPDMEANDYPIKICTVDTMTVLIPAFEIVLERFFMDNPDENVEPSSFKKNDLYNDFMKYISEIKERDDKSKDGEYWYARSEIMKALFDISKKYNQEGTTGDADAKLQDI